MNGAKSYKHIKLMPLNIIKQVIDIKETEGKDKTLLEFDQRMYKANYSMFTIEF